jgi:uncharacterized protein with PIN domain
LDPRQAVSKPARRHPRATKVRRRWQARAKPVQDHPSALLIAATSGAFRKHLVEVEATMADEIDLQSCPLCGGGGTSFRGTTEVMMGPCRVAVDDSYKRCVECGEGFYAPGQLERMERAVAAPIHLGEG